VITARRTRLHRAPTLPAFRAALVALVPVDSIDRARETFVLVPTRSAGQLLRRTIEDLRLRPGAAIVLPDVLTRRDWYERLHQRTPGLPRLLTPFEREVLRSRRYMKDVKRFTASVEVPLRKIVMLVATSLFLMRSMPRANSVRRCSIARRSLA